MARSLSMSLWECLVYLHCVLGMKNVYINGSLETQLESLLSGKPTTPLNSIFVSLIIQSVSIYPTLIFNYSSLFCECIKLIPRAGKSLVKQCTPVGKKISFLHYLWVKKHRIMAEPLAMHTISTKYQKCTAYKTKHSHSGMDKITWLDCVRCINLCSCAFVCVYIPVKAYVLYATTARETGLPDDRFNSAFPY